MYEEWVKRHYKPELYKYQTTWQASYDRCRSDDATLLTIKDQEEADFIKVGICSISDNKLIVNNYLKQEMTIWDQLCPNVICYKQS